MVAAVLLLGGCETVLVAAVEDARWAHEEARAYVREVDADREWVRARCRELLVKEIDQLESEGDFAAARARLKASYPGLVTLDLIRQGREDPERLLAEPSLCN